MHGTFKTIETKADPLSLESLIAWLEKQPASKRYCYMDNGACLLAQYLPAVGIDVKRVGGKTFTLTTGEQYPLGHFEDVAAERPRTFGAALKRARAALTSCQG